MNRFNLINYHTEKSDVINAALKCMARSGVGNTLEYSEWLGVKVIISKKELQTHTFILHFWLNCMINLADMHTGIDVFYNSYSHIVTKFSSHL